jgi:hypothetical protein
MIPPEFAVHNLSHIRLEHSIAASKSVDLRGAFLGQVSQDGSGNNNSLCLATAYPMLFMFGEHN